MADDQLIDGYLARLRRELAWRSDADEIVDEAADHLLSATERLTADGVDRGEAERLAIEHFGDTTTIATDYASSSNGGLAVPTKFTKLAGVAALVAAPCWLAVAAGWMAAHLLDVEGVADVIAAYGILASLVGASVATTLAVLGLIRRHGGLGLLGHIGLTLMGLGVVATLLFWFVMGWAVLFAAGMLLVALAANGRGLAPRASVVAFGAAWSAGAITWSVLRALEVGTRDQWGDYPIVSPIAIAVGVAILVPGLIGIGRWLAAETPVDLDIVDPLTTG